MTYRPGWERRTIASHAPPHAKLKMHVWYVFARLKHFMVCIPIYS